MGLENERATVGRFLGRRPGCWCSVPPSCQECAFKVVCRGAVIELAVGKKETCDVSCLRAELSHHRRTQHSAVRIQCHPMNLRKLTSHNLLANGPSASAPHHLPREARADQRDDDKKGSQAESWLQFHARNGTVNAEKYPRTPVGSMAGCQRAIDSG